MGVALSCEDADRSHMMYAHSAATSLLSALGQPAASLCRRQVGCYLLASWTLLASIAFMPLRVSSSPVTDTSFPAMSLRPLYGSALS